MLRFLVLAIIVAGNITKRGTGLVGGLGWKDESRPRALKLCVCAFYNGFINRVVNGQCVYRKKTPGGAGTHTGHTSAHPGTRMTQTNLTTIPTH